MRYINLEIGDLVKFRDLFQGVKAYGIDYRILQNPNGQYYFPLFIVTATTKNLDSVSIECMQLHNLAISIEGSDNINIGWFKWDNPDDLFYFPDADPIVISEDDVEPSVTLVDEVIIPPNSIGFFILAEEEYSSVIPLPPNTLWQIMYPQRFLPRLRESFITEDIGNGIISIYSGTHEELDAPMDIANVEDWYSTSVSPYVCMKMEFAPHISEIGSPTKSVLFKDINAIDEQHDMNMWFDEPGAGIQGDVDYSHATTRAVALTNFSSVTITYTPENQVGLLGVDVGGATNPYTPTDPSVLSGDVNNDGIVNILDVVSTVNIVLGMTDWVDAADYNNDGVINVIDIVSINNVILYG